MSVQFVKVNENTEAIVTPYNANFVAEIKHAIGTDRARWNSAARRWQYPITEHDKVAEIAEKHFGGETTRSIIEWNFERNYKPVRIDGVDVIEFQRDFWSNKKATIVEETLKTGGSRRNPTLAGKLVIEYDLRKNAIIEPEPTSIKAANTSGQEPSLGSKTDKQQLTELLNTLTDAQISDLLKVAQDMGNKKEENKKDGGFVASPMARMAMCF